MNASLPFEWKAMSMMVHSVQQPVSCMMAMGEQCAAAPTSDCLMPTTFLLSVTHTPSPPGLEWIGCGDEISDCVMPVPAYYLSSVLVTLWSETTHSYWCFIATWWQWCPAQHLWLITKWGNAMHAHAHYPIHNYSPLAVSHPWFI